MCQSHSASACSSQAPTGVGDATARPAATGASALAPPTAHASAPAAPRPTPPAAAPAPAAAPPRSSAARAAPCARRTAPRPGRPAATPAPPPTTASRPKKRCAWRHVRSARALRHASAAEAAWAQRIECKGRRTRASTSGSKLHDRPGRRWRRWIEHVREAAAGSSRHAARQAVGHTERAAPRARTGKDSDRRASLRLTRAARDR
jgi:hypothetical protein